MDQLAGAVQPSLLHGVNLEKQVPRQFDLGMDDFVSSTAFEKEKENWRLSLRKKSMAQTPDLSARVWQLLMRISSISVKMTTIVKCRFSMSPEN